MAEVDKPPATARRLVVTFVPEARPYERDSHTADFFCTGVTEPFSPALSVDPP
jgi:hypothetical protein